MPKKFTPVEAQNYRQEQIRQILSRRDQHKVEIFIQCIEVDVCLYVDYSTRSNGPDKRAQAKIERARKQAEKLVVLLGQISSELKKSAAYSIAEAGFKPNMVPRPEQLVLDAQSLFRHIWFYDWIINDKKWRKKRGAPPAMHRDVLIALIARRYEFEQRFGPASSAPASLFSKVVKAVLYSLNQPLADPKFAIRKAKGLLVLENVVDSGAPSLAEILSPETGK